MDLHYHLKGKVKALKSTGAEIMVAKFRESMNLRNVWEIKGNTKTNAMHGARGPHEF